jgi:hypothetical protein
MFDLNQDLEVQAIAKAKEDPAFKQLLLTNPKAAIEQEIGQTLPANLEIEVVQQTKHKLYMILPLEKDEIQTQELSDRELEAVSGGTGWSCVSITISVVTATVCSETWPCRR